jgi:hypothetical protein
MHTRHDDILSLKMKSVMVSKGVYGANYGRSGLYRDFIVVITSADIKGTFIWNVQMIRIEGGGHANQRNLGKMRKLAPANRASGTPVEFQQRRIGK